MVERVPLRKSLPYRGVLYLQRVKRHEPDWVPFVSTGLVQPLTGIRNATSSALLVLSTAGHLFAVTFGQGRYFLREDRLERDFGLRVVLNAVDPDSLRSVDLRTLDETMVLTRRQTTRGSSIEVFGVDVSRDMLRAVTGTPTRTSLGTRITGADRLSFSVPLTIDELGACCDELLVGYNDTRYKTRFGWIDKLRLLRTSELTNALDQLLVAHIEANEFDRLRLAAPEQIEWEQAEGYRYSVDDPRSPLHGDLEIADYVAAAVAKRGEAPDLKRLRSDYAMVMGDTLGPPRHKWSIYRAVAFDVEYAGATYALTDGRWYEIETSFANDITAQVAQLADSDLEFPPAIEGEREDHYLARVAPQMSVTAGIHVAVMDKKTVKATGAHTPVEVCDLLSQYGHFVHVKKGDQSSALSHLFSQGAISAELFLVDEEFRHGTRAHVAGTPCDSDDLFPALIPRDHVTVVYAVVDRRVGTLAETLPFFSKVNLANHARRLRAFGCRVQTKHVGLT